MNATRQGWAAIAAAATALAVIAAGSPGGNPAATTTVVDDQAAIRAACLERLADPRPLTTPQRNWLRNCRDAFAPAPTPTVTPSATESPTVSPSPTPTVSPSSPTPTGCMPIPSACGYPDSTSTGVPPGTILTVRTGDLHLTTPGLYTGLDVTGCVYIEASNITIRNSRIRGNCWFSIRTAPITGGYTGLVVEDTEIVLASTLNGAYGICCSNYTLTRVWIHTAHNSDSTDANAGADCVYFNTNIVVQHSFCEVGALPCLGDVSCTSAHSDGMTSDGGNNVLLDHNTIRNPNRQTSAILLSTNSGPVINTTIRNGLYAGGGYTVYCGTDTGGVDIGTVFSGNRIARDWNGAAPGYWPNGGFWGPTVHCAGLGGGNVWDDTGLILMFFGQR